jgi:hypothetical protein
MRKAGERAANRRAWLSVETLALAALVLIAPIPEAYAYVDPNAAGPLYQFLFPLLVATASAFALLRQVIRRLWSQLTSKLVAVLRGEAADSGNTK